MHKWYKNEIEMLKSPVRKNFDLWELRCRCKKCTMTLLSNELLNKLQDLRELYNGTLTVNSCYRCQEHNRNVKGSKYSYHQKGEAVDLSLVNQDSEKLMKSAKRIFPVVKIYKEKNFMHCDIGKKRNW